MKSEGGCIIEVPFAMDTALVVGGGVMLGLVKGLFVQCPEHPRYRAMRKPTAYCRVCEMMYERRLK